ncbi:MAG TPA: ATP-binding protein [Candidatus Angelobacter sp.]
MSTRTDFPLSPAQNAALNALLQAVQVGRVVHLQSATGLGKTAILRQLQQKVGGIYLNNREMMETAAGKHPLQLEDAFYSVVLKALKGNDVVIVDDFDLVHQLFCCNHFYQRSHFIDVPMLLLCEYAEAAGKKLVFAARSLPSSAERRSYLVELPRFQVADYCAIAESFLKPDTLKNVDFAKVYRFAPKLNAHQIRSACEWLTATEPDEINTERFIEYLRCKRLASNVNLEEVESVDLAQLKGVDDVLRSLGRNIVLPLENDELANELGLRAKRGVLLYGPPGTGKTTVGRALAHRLKGKFFLIDGTFIAGTDDFYNRVHHIFELAKENAPSVIFLDDADAIFEDGEERGLYRYLLTILDGLENEGAGRICLMLTAMDLAHLPPALVRSGRVELWLEMKLPDQEARGLILRQHLGTLPAYLQTVRDQEIVACTEGFTGADLKRLVEDAKALYAYDRAALNAPQEFTSYLLTAAEGLRDNKRRFAAAGASVCVTRQQNNGSDKMSATFVQHMAQAAREDS